MIVVDSSVWVAHLRDISSEPVRKLRVMEDLGEIIVGDLILLELLQGARDARHARRIETALLRFPIHTMLGPTLSPIAAAHYRALRSLGITIRKTIDVVIATFCIAGGHVLLHDDRDFEPFARHLSLRTM